MNTTLRFWILFIVFLVSSLPSYAGQEFGFHFTRKTSSVKIPIEVYHNLILVPIRINDSFEMNFILDTGVKTTILTEMAIARFLSLQHVRDIQVRGLGVGENIDAYAASGLTIKLPGVEGKNMGLIILPPNILNFSELFGQPVYGIIGYDLFQYFTIEINYEQEYIRLYDPAKYKVRGRKNVEIPLEMKRFKPFIKTGWANKDTTQKGKNATMLLDTGASQAVSFFYKDIDIPKLTIDTYLGLGLNGDIYGKLGKVSGFSIDKFRFDGVVAAYPDEASLNFLSEGNSWHGSIGGEILKRFNVVFDYPHKRLILKKNADYNKPFTYNSSGVELIAIGDQYEQLKVNFIRPGSPADKAGLKEGDILLTLNGTSTNTMDIGQIYRNLNRKPGKKVCINLRRGGEKLKKCFRIWAEI